MKASKPEKLSIIIMLALVSFVSIFSFSIITKPVNAENSIRETNHKLECFIGQSEFYYKPAGDTRLWRVINTYYELDSDNNDCHNMSYYEFYSDSVLVINQYVGVPAQDLLEASLSNPLLLADNFSNK